MFFAIFVLSIGAVLFTSACRVDPAAGCASDDDCRQGRVCVQAVCQFPGQSSSNPNDAGNQQDQPPFSPIIRIVPDRVTFGPLSPGEGDFRTIRIFNDGDATLLLDRVTTTGDGYWDTGLDRSSVAPGGDPALIDVNVNVGPMPPGEFTLEGELQVGSNAFNSEDGRIRLETQVILEPIEEGVCLNLWNQSGSDEFFMQTNESMGIDFGLANCGGVPVTIVGAEAFTSDGRFALDLELIVGDIEVGGSRSAFLEIHSPEGEAETDVTVQVVYMGDSGPETVEYVIFVVSGEGNNEDCGPTPFAQADRNGPWTEGEMVVELGHHIDISLPDRDGFFANAELVLAPDGSSHLFQMRSEQNAVLVPDMPGQYEVDVTTSFDGSCEDEHFFNFEVILPEAEFVAWVTWPEPLPRGRVNDLDFYVSEKTAEGYFWEDSEHAVGGGVDNAEFGDPDSESDNPFRNQDYNNQGYGPELVVIPEPHPDSTIAIGVHVFSTAVRDQVEPRIQLWLNGEPTVDATLGVDRNEFWIAAEVKGTELLGTYEIVTDGFPAAEQP